MKKTKNLLLASMCISLIFFNSCGPDAPSGPKKYQTIPGYLGQGDKKYTCPPGGTGCEIIVPTNATYKPLMIDHLARLKMYYNADNVAGYFNDNANEWQETFPSLEYDTVTLNKVKSGEYKMFIQESGTETGVLIYKNNVITEDNIILALFFNPES